MLRLSLVMLLRDESPHVETTIRSVERFIDEIVVFDTGSRDDTLERCLRLGARGVKIETDFHKFHFGEARTAAGWMARGVYILMLDGDERLTGGEHLADLVELMEARNWLAVGLPRRRWLDLGMRQQTELEAYPDWQARLYRNLPSIRWNRALHETLSVKAENVFFPYGRPIHIEHLVDPLHLADPNRRTNRAIQRKILSERAGVPQEGSNEAHVRALGIVW